MQHKTKYLALGAIGGIAACVLSIWAWEAYQDWRAERAARRAVKVFGQMMDKTLQMGEQRQAAVGKVFRARLDALYEDLKHFNKDFEKRGAEFDRAFQAQQAAVQQRLEKARPPEKSPAAQPGQGADKDNKTSAHSGA